MDLQKRNDSLVKAKKQLNDKSFADKVHKDGKLTAYDVMTTLFDEGTFVETNAYVKAYANELGTSNPEEYEGVVCGYGAIDGRLTFAYAQNCARMNGAFQKLLQIKLQLSMIWHSRTVLPLFLFLIQTVLKSRKALMFFPDMALL